MIDYKELALLLFIWLMGASTSAIFLVRFLPQDIINNLMVLVSSMLIIATLVLIYYVKK